MTDWRYRYSAGGEREQKRMYTWRQLNDTLFHTRAWVYYALGGGKEQLAVYHGLEVAFDNPDVLCEGPSDDRVYFYPVEYNTFGGGISRIATRPNALSSAGIKEYKIADHLGSTRLGIDAVAGVTPTVDYEPFGKAVTGLAGAGTPRQSFIDKEKDWENGYGDFGVRKYEEETGRFLSMDPLWERLPSTTPYHYAASSPLSLLDPTGLAEYYYNSNGTLSDVKDNGWFSGPDRYFYEDPDGGGPIAKRGSTWWQLEGRISRASSGKLKGVRDGESLVRKLAMDHAAEGSFPTNIGEVLGKSPTGAEWDFKTSGAFSAEYLYAFGTKRMAFHADFAGNVAWGVIMSESGWPLGSAALSAGLYQTFATGSSASYWSNNWMNMGDDPRDTYAIIHGYRISSDPPCAADVILATGKWPILQ